MGGRLTVESTPGQGSCFTLALDLPITTLPPAELPAQTSIQLRGRILMVEDHPVNQKVLAHQLREMGLQYAVAVNGLQALDLLARTLRPVRWNGQMPEWMDWLHAADPPCRRYPPHPHHACPPMRAGFRVAASPQAPTSN